MNKQVNVTAFPVTGIAIGVFWFAYGKVGFWWALVYGVFWPVWLGFKVAEALALGVK